MAHDLSIRRVGHEAEILRELRVEKSQDLGHGIVRERDRGVSVENQMERRFHAPPSVHQDDGGHDRVMNTNTR